MIHGTKMSPARRWREIVAGPEGEINFAEAALVIAAPLNWKAMIRDP